MGICESAGAGALAGLSEAKRKGLLHAGENVVVFNTGSGLKDVSAATRVTGGPTVIPAQLTAVAEAYDPGISSDS